MAQITLKINGDNKEVLGKIEEVKNELKSIESQKITITVDRSGTKALEDSVASVQRLGNAATNTSKSLHQIKTDTAGNTQEINRFNLAIGKTRTIIEETGKDSQKTTEIITTNFDKQRQAAERAAQADAKYAGEAKKFLLEEEQAAKRATDAAAAIPTKFQEQINALTGVDRAYKSAAESAKAFERATAGSNLSVMQQTYSQSSARTASQNLAYERYLSEMSASAAPTAMQEQINAVVGVDRAYKSAAESAEIFRMNGLTPLEKSLRNSEKAMDDVTGASESLISNVVKFTKWYVIGNAVSGVVRSFRDAINTMKEVDDELVTVRKVTDFTADEMAKIEERAYKTATAYGVAADAYLESVAAFARAGYKDQSEALAELSVKTQLVGDTTAETANQFLLSVDKAYQYEGSIEKLTAVLDGANELDNRYATSIEKIAEGLGTVAPVAKQANVGIDELTAAIGTITAVTQRSGTEAARALRALMLNIVGDTKTEIDEGVTWTTGEIANLRDVIKNYAPEAYNAAQATGAIIDPMEAIAGLAQAMKDGLLTEQQLMETVSDIGGKLRTSQLLALIQNWDMYQSMLSDYGNALGSADKEVQNALDSWNRKTEQLKNSWTRFVATVVDTRAIKSAIDQLVKLLDALSSKIGGNNFTFSYITGDMEAWIDGYILRLGKTDEATVKYRESLVSNMKQAIDAYFDATQAGQKMSDEQTRLIQTMMEMLGYYGKYTPAIEDNTAATEDNTDAKSDNAAATDNLASSEETLKTAFEEVEKKSSLTYGTLEELDKIYPGLSAKIVDASGNLTEQGQAALSTKSAFVDLIAQEVIFNNTTLDVGGKIAALQALAVQAGLTGALVSSVFTGGLQKAIMDEVDNGMSFEQAQQNILSSYSHKIQAGLNQQNYISAPKTSSGGSSKASSTKSTKDEELERLKKVVSLRESELSFLKASGASEDERIAKMREIQDALHDQAEYMRSIGADQSEINAMSTKWWSVQKDIEDTTDSIAKKLNDEIAETVKDITDALGKQQKELANALQEQIDGLKDEHDALKENNDEAEKRLAIEKATIALRNAENERNVRQYNSRTGQWEWVANAKTVEKARQDLVNARDDLSEYLAEKEYKAALDNLEQQKEYTNNAFNSFKEAWEEAAQAIRDGKMSYQEAYAYIKAAMEKIYDDYGVDLSGTLDEAGETLLSGMEVFDQFIRNALETDNPADAIKAFSDAIKEGIITDLNDVNAILKALNGQYEGVTSEVAKLWAIAKMQYNSAAYHTADEAGRESLHDENLQIGKQLGWRFDSGTGLWYDQSGNVAYQVNTSNADVTYQPQTQQVQTVQSAPRADDSHDDDVAYIESHGGVATGDSRKDSIIADLWALYDQQNGYDSGGILHGLGGIKATAQDELVLPPDLTQAVIKPALDGSTAKALDDMRVIYGVRTPQSITNVRGGSSIGTQNNGDTIIINGLDVSSRITMGTTIGELAQEARNLGLHYNS